MGAIATQEQKEKVTAAEYLAREADAETKSEFHAGEISAMAGAQEPHNIIVANLIAELVFCLKKRGCRVYNSDQLLHLPECERYVYPDISVVCAKPELEKHRGIDALLNPMLLIEVLSESTAPNDKGFKLDCYIKLNSLQTYAIVDSHKKGILIYRRQDDKHWTLQRIDETDKTIDLVGCQVALEDIYRLVL